MCTKILRSTYSNLVRRTRSPRSLPVSISTRTALWCYNFPIDYSVFYTFKKYEIMLNADAKKSLRYRVSRNIVTTKVIAYSTIDICHNNNNNL